MPVRRMLNQDPPVLIWTEDIADNALAQLGRLARLPFIHHHVAAMPDVHWGLGATIGSVIATRGALVPAAVGVDLGCGMQAVRTTLEADRLPGRLGPLRSAIEAEVPHGRTRGGRQGDAGAWQTPPAVVADCWRRLQTRYERVCERHPGARGRNTARHLGTLGGGNHFIELCLDERDRVWVLLHSGSRGPGNRIGTYFIERAREAIEREGLTGTLPDLDLAYLSEDSAWFDDYREAVLWAQDFAAANRRLMMARILAVLRARLGPFSIADAVIDCHHNYVARERHFGADVWVTRKGAIRARRGDLGVVPGSMGAASYIVRGKGEPQSFCSCAHGAGRALGRREARRRYSAEDLAAQTRGIECPKDAARVDEIPAAYKPIESVMANQSDLVEIVHSLRQVVNVKG